MGGKKKRDDDDDDDGSLVGRRVLKHFKGFGKFSGTVTAYSATRRFYKVVYDDGDREELEAHEVAEILVDSVEASAKRGRFVENDKASLKRATDTSLKKESAERGPGGNSKTNDLELCEELGHRSRGRQSAQCVRSDAVKEGPTCSDGYQEDERQIDGDVQQSSRRNEKRKRREETKQVDEEPRPTKSKNSNGYGRRPRPLSRTRRGEKLLQISDDDESDADSDESSEIEPASSEKDIASSKSSDVENSDVMHAEVSERLELPTLLPLPSSSRDFELSDDLVAEVFAIYSFLRSFSRALFLSPFCLDDFVKSLTADTSNHLFDSIHLSLLQAVRRHLQRLLKDGSREAEACLRQPNWNLLDIITWPSFLVVFLQTYGFSKLYGKHVHSLGLMDCEYYKVGLKTKLAALSFLCDQVMETDEIRAELDNRELICSSQSRQKDRRKVTVHSVDAPEKVSRIDWQTSSKHEAAPRSTRRLSTQSSAAVVKAAQAEISEDWNSDECVLCGMNGNLICCDGCPAAYHSRCVGITRASLPPGDWFCPECIVEKVGGETSKRAEGLRGDQLLGVDPYGRTFISTCGYLLVLESCDELRSSYKYYNKDDIAGVLENLEMLRPACAKISSAICQHWNVPFRKSNDSREELGDVSENSFPVQILEDQGIQLRNDLDAQDILSPPSMRNCADGSQNSVEVKAPKTLITPSAAMKLDTNLEGRQSTIVNGSANKESVSHSADYNPFLSQRVNDRDEKGRFLTVGSREYSQPKQFHKFGSYTNLYLQGDAAATSAANLALMTADEKCLTESKILKKKTRATTTAEQLKAFFQAPVRFCWPSFKKKFMEIPKERCGWCFCCSNSYMKRGCLINQVATHLAAGAACVAGGIRPTKSGPGHLSAVAGYILHIEDKLHSFLLGPWENIAFRRLWRRKVELATCVHEVRTALLELEANLRVVVFSEDWSKCLEDAPSLFLGGTSALAANEVLIRKGCSRKPVRRLGSSQRGSSKCSGNALGTIKWWRRGKVAHRLSGWAILPKKLARRVVYQAGLKKIIGLTYVEGGEIPKRSKQIAWRARAESACTTAELAVQVRYLDAQLRWDDLSSDVQTSTIDTKSDQDVPVVETPAIYAKSSEGGVCLYLVDSTLNLKHGLEQSLSSVSQGSEAVTRNGEKQWVDEFHVPLPLLRDYEEKDRLLRQNKSQKLALLQKQYINAKEESKKDIFNFLAERAGVFLTTKLLMSSTCKFCNLKVLASIAVQCRNCKGPFHKDCTTVSKMQEGHEPERTCHGCLQIAAKHKSLPIKQRVAAHFGLPESVKVNLDTASVCSENQQVSCSPELSSSGQFRVSLKAPRNFLKQQQNTPCELPNKGQPQSQSPSAGSWSQFCSKREDIALDKKVYLVHEEVSDDQALQFQQSTQLDSLPSSGTPNSVNRKSERNLPSEGIYWRRNGTASKTLGKDKLLLPGHQNKEVSAGPKCFLCRQAYRSELLYIRCEYCPLWFHGDAVGVTKENFSNVLALKCHKCRKKSGPVCPHGLNHKNSRQNVPHTVCHRQDGSGLTGSEGIKLRYPGFSSKEGIQDALAFDELEKQVQTDSSGRNSPNRVVSEHSREETQTYDQLDFKLPNSGPVFSDELVGVAVCNTSLCPVDTGMQQVLMELEPCGSAVEGAVELESKRPLRKNENFVLQEDAEQIKETNDCTARVSGDVLSTEGSECFWDAVQYPRATLSFTELLSSEDDRVEELAQVAMDFGQYWFEISDPFTIPDNCEQNSSAYVSGFETENMGEGCSKGQSQYLDTGNLGADHTGLSLEGQEKVSMTCALCSDGSTGYAVQCFGCGMAVHKHCLEWSHVGVWTGHGWACNGCKAQFLQGQDASAQCMQLIDSRILLQS